MENDIKFRALKPEEIDVRTAHISEKGVQLLLYKDARVDYKILDETFGVFGWTNSYYEIDKVLYCSVGVWNPRTGEYVPKANCGVESFAEAEKGRASDAFKRACFALGIGRELYTKIFIFVQVPTKKNDKGKYELVDRYAKWDVSDIYTNEETQKIEYLQIIDKGGNIVFTYGKKPVKKKAETVEKTDTIKPKQEKVLTREQLEELMEIAKGSGDLVVKVAKDFKYDNPREIKEKDFEEIKTAIAAEILMS